MYRKKGKKAKKIKNAGCNKALPVEKVEDKNLKDSEEKPEKHQKEKKSANDGSSLEDFKGCAEEIKKIDKSRKFQIEFINVNLIIFALILKHNICHLVLFKENIIILFLYN